jgi:cytochrome c oxidase cbb3-type subunit 2
MLRHRIRELALVVTILLVAFLVYRMQPSAPVAASLSPIERGRLVYISEGCIHCHSQYVRPNTADVLMWGPVESLDELHRQQPPLIGNRRQGPDLSQVGGRRSPLWLKAHLYNPREVSGASIMPSYAFLFRDRRGNDLVAYLTGLQSPASPQHAPQQKWHLPTTAISAANPDDGQRLYSRFCATCHNSNGRTRNTWQSGFVEQPAVLSTDSALGVQSSAPAPTARIDHFAQIVKFGIPNSDMAGHEYLSDKDVASISLWLAQNTAQPARNP